MSGEHKSYDAGGDGFAGGGGSSDAVHAAARRGEVLDTDAVAVGLDTRGEASVTTGRIAKSGWLQKKHYPMGGVCSCLPPTWKSRFVVCKGGYIFRFEKESSKNPKGTPTSVADANVDVAVDEEGDRCFVVSSIRKETTYRAATPDERDEWVGLLRRERQRAIKVAMGHVKVTEEELEAKKVGDNLVRRRAQREARDGAEGSDMKLLSELTGAGTTSMPGAMGM